MLKDVVKRERVRNVDFLETLAIYTADNVGSLFSANNISRYLKSQHVNISPLQVINYLKALQNAFLIHKVRRIDVNGLQTFENTRQREFGNLQAIRNNYPKFVVSLDEWTSGSTINVIKHVHLGEFLLSS